jgi:hypothetical protein
VPDLTCAETLLAGPTSRSVPRMVRLMSPPRQSKRRGSAEPRLAAGEGSP